MSSRLLFRGLTVAWTVICAAIFFYVLPTASSPRLLLYAAFLATLQASLFMLPAWLLARLHRRFPSPWLALLCHAVVISTVVLLFANLKLHSMYGFFIDGFVLNLTLTPGGIAALGLSRSFYVTASGWLLAMVAIYLLLIRYLPLEKRLPALPVRERALALIVLLVAESLSFAYASYSGGTAVTSVARGVPWHANVSARGLFRSMGLPEKERLASAGDGSFGALNYPSIASNRARIGRRYNVVWLTAESLRWDMLNEQVMPNTFALAQQGQWFRHHVSGGNGTRMGIFAQFYGLYPSYWPRVLEERRSPLLLDLLQQAGYTMRAYTSAHFSYPEFDKTVFSGFRDEQLQEYHVGRGWERDRKNVDDLTRFIAAQKSRSQPFFTFMFFESSHANYYFPENAVIAPDYLEDFDYLSTDIGAEIQRIKNRYINATHYLDRQLGRVFDSLRKADLLHNTIVVVTGDHGEEFMENGYWGHNSTFSEQQIRVPLVIYLPGEAAQTFNHMTSHIDLPATLLAALAVDIGEAGGGFGRDLLAPDYHRDYAVVGDWHGAALVTDTVKFVMSSKGLAHSSRVTAADDSDIGAQAIPERDYVLLSNYIQERTRFFSPSPTHRQAEDLHRRDTDRIFEGAEGTRDGLGAAASVNASR